MVVLVTCNSIPNRDVVISYLHSIAMSVEESTNKTEEILSTKLADTRSLIKYIVVVSSFHIKAISLQ